MCLRLRRSRDVVLCPGRSLGRVAKGDPGFVVMERCHPLELKAARASPGKLIEWTSTTSRRQAKAFSRLVKKAEAGETPTERDYIAAGCRQYSVLPE